MLVQHGAAASPIAKDARHRAWLNHVWDSDLPGGREHLDNLTHQYESFAPRKFDDAADVAEEVAAALEVLVVESDEGEGAGGLFGDEDGGAGDSDAIHMEDDAPQGEMVEEEASGESDDGGDASQGEMVEEEASGESDDGSGYGGERAEAEDGESSDKSDSDSGFYGPEYQQAVADFCANVDTTVH